MMEILCSLIIALASFSLGSTGTDETVEANAGEPFILNFGYGGPTLGISHDLTKDGEKVVVDNTRTFMQLDKLYFTEIYELDSGKYHLAVTGDRADFEKTIVISVTKRMDSQHSQSQGSYSPELAVLKAIGEEHKEAVKRSTVEVDDSLPINPFSHLRSLTPMAAKHAKARVTFERILIRARRQAGNQTIPPLAFFPMLQFAQCVDPPMPQDCSAAYRSTDGTCNNLANPLQGASNTAFRRLLPAEYEDGIYVPIGANQTINGDPFAGPWPSPRLISNRIILDEIINNAGFSMFFTVFGQSIALDFTRFGEYDTAQCALSCNNITANLPFCIPISVEADDPIYGVDGSNQGRCLIVRRAIGSCMIPFNSTFDEARQQINQPTHYLDASGIYGNNDVEATALRLFTGGQLRQSARTDTYKGDLPILPPDMQAGPNPPFFFFAGDIRVENYVHQINMYTLWYRLHNYIVGRLAEINPCWDDERLFQEGRKIVGAIWQVVIYREYLPLLFGDQFDTYIGNYTGYDSSVDATVPHSFATAAGRFGHSMFQGETNRLDSEGNMLPVGVLGLRNAFFNPAEYYRGGGLDPLVRGMLQDQSRELDQFLTIVLTALLFPLPNATLGSDLASLNIQRAREHGVPPYRRWQRYCYDIHGVNASFMSRVNDTIRAVYGEYGYANGIDLWVGGLSEEKLPGTIFGPTLACMVGRTYSDLRAGDRFYWENPSMFNTCQRDSLSQMTVSKVICENADSITNIRRSAFSLSGDPVNCSSLPFVDLTLWRDLECSANGVTVRFSQSTYRVDEEDGSVQAVLLLDQPVSTSVTVRVSSNDRSATGGVDYVSGPFSVTIPAGKTSASFDVTIINDNIYEENESFRLTIVRSSTPNNVQVGRPRRATVVIRDDDDCPPCDIARNVTVIGGGVIVRFSSGNPGTTFTCRLDSNPPGSCTSPTTYTSLSSGRHRVIVIADCPCNTGRDSERFRFRIP